MRRRYRAELDELAGTYRTALETVVDDLVDIVSTDRPMIFVGSGGALAVARLAADLHARTTGQVGISLTPLEATTTPFLPNTGFVLFSAKGRNPDAALAITAGRNRGNNPLAVVTCRSREDLPPALNNKRVRVVTIASSPDGFLATNSVLAMATVICRAYGAQLPLELPALEGQEQRALGEECLVLTGPGYGAIAIDLEARLSEIGLATVQLADYRNLAHGRHVGLQRRAGTTTVVTTIAPESRELAERTISLLPCELKVVPFQTDLSWPAGVVDLLVMSMRATATTAEAQSIDPGHPSVPLYGRQLYNMPLRRLVPSPRNDPVRCKLIAAGLTDAERPGIQLAFSNWLKDIRRTRFSALVLDYDGTCCPTYDRCKPPPREVQTGLIRLAEAGILIGFATGRGRSVHTTTRDWLPRGLWETVIVGMYNGTVMLRLSEEPGEYTNCDGPLAEAADRLEGLALDGNLKVERRRTQVTIFSGGGVSSGARLLPLVLAVLARDPEIPCNAVASGHSVDVLPAHSGKRAVIEAVQQAAQGHVLAIGDQGQVGGNDFELLAATPWSLSVDRCSGDPTRCWNLDSTGLCGPELLVKYLEASTGEEVFRFTWNQS